LDNNNVFEGDKKYKKEMLNCVGFFKLFFKCFSGQRLNEFKFLFRFWMQWVSSSIERKREKERHKTIIVI